MDHQLLVFKTVAEKQNFTKAAEELFLTQSAVSLHIRSLEKKYGIKLFERTNKYVRLTKGGEILYFHAKDILNQYAHVQKLLDDLIHVASGPLSIGSGYTFGEYLLPKIISEFKKDFSNVTPSITIKNSKRIASQISRHELDLGIVEGHIEQSKLEVFPFAKDELVIIMSPAHELAQSNEVEFSRLKDETWILRESGSGTRGIIDRVFAKFDFSPKAIMEFGSSQIIKESVEAGLGISVISKWAIKKEIALHTLHYVKIKNTPIERDLFCITNSSMFKTKATELFLEFLCQYKFLKD